MAMRLEELQARVRAVARPEEDPDALLEMAVQEFIGRRKYGDAAWEAARAEAQAVLNGPRRPHAESDAEFRRRHNIPPLGETTHDELIAQAEAALAALPPEQIAEAQRLGLL